MLYIVHMDAGTQGTAGTEIFEADSMEEAERIGWDIACDWAASYFDIIEEDQEDPCDDPDDEYMSSYIYTSDIGCTVDVYDPENPEYIELEV